MNDNKHLYMPQGIVENAEIFSGFGKEELTKTILVSIIGIVIAIFLWVITAKVTASVIVVFIAIALSMGLFTKANNISIWTKLCGILKYFKSQKFYPFRYLDEWSGNNESNY